MKTSTYVRAKTGRRRVRLPRLKSTMLAIDWMSESVTVVELNLRNAQTEVVRRFHEQWPEDCSDDAAAAGKWLAARLQASGMEAKDAIVSAPRQDIVVRLLEAPKSVEDIIALAHAQAEIRSGQPLENLSVDCMPQSVGTESAHAHVLMATAGRNVTERIETVLKHAGIRATAISSGELCIPALSRSQDDGLRLDILCNTNHTELVFSRDRCAVSAYSLRTVPHESGSSAQQIVATANRVLEGLPKDVGGDGISEAAIFGARSGDVSDEVSQLMPCIVARLPLHEDEHNDARLLALVNAFRSDTDRIDFTHPCQPINHKGIRRARYLRIAGLATVFIALCSAAVYQEQNQLDLQLQALEVKHRNLEQLIIRGQPIRDAQVFLNTWHSGQPDWLAEVHDFLELMPSKKLAFLTKLELEHRADSAVAFIRANGLAQSAEDILELNSRIMKRDKRYVLQPRGIENDRQDAKFPARFSTEVQLQTEPAPQRQRDRTTADSSNDRQSESVDRRNDVGLQHHGSSPGPTYANAAAAISAISHHQTASEERGGIRC
ncbi:MAG: hypothetical protein GY758_08940 [Fuerstiella sp.]|nr:hypothetical protein [Fuerstiella sp.]MCP4509861.1 hypothetical protein [Fuerstiella sp.]